MANFQISAGSTFEEFETIGDWTLSSNAVASVSSSVFRTGTGSLKLQNNGGGVSATATATKTISADLSRAGAMGIWVYIENDDNTSNIQITFSSTTDFSKNFNLGYSSNVHEGWNYIPLGRSQWTNTGGEDWGNTMIRFRVSVAGTDASTVGTAYFDSLVVQRYNRPKCVMFFDDFPATAYTVAYPYLRKYGFRATHSGVSDYPGIAGKMTLAQILETHDEGGWDVVNHTSDHTNLSTLGTQAEMEAKIAPCKAWMIANGFTRNNEHLLFVYPQSGTNATAEAAISAQGMLVARGNYNRSQASYVDRPYLICGNANPSPVTAATIKAKIDRAIADGADTFLYFHILETPELNSNYLDPTIFYEVVDYLAAKREHIDCITFTEWYRGITQSRRVI